MTEKIPVAVLGATGAVGQKFVTLLADHPWFEIAALAASERSAGKRYGEVARWMDARPLPPHIGEMEVHPCEPGIPGVIVNGSVLGGGSTSTSGYAGLFLRIRDGSGFGFGSSTTAADCSGPVSAGPPTPLSSIDARRLCADVTA